MDFSALELDSLKTKFMGFISESQNIREKIKENLPAVLESSRDNIRFISEEIDKVYAKPKKVKLLDFNRPEFYMGEHICARMGYAADGNIRANAASGGMVTALLCHMLETGEIDGAWVTRSEIKDGKLGYKTFIATTREELMESSSSVYMYMPLMKHVDMLREFNGKLAVVLVPCQMRAFTAMLEKEPALKEKVVLKLGLYCSGSHSENATLVPLRKKKISLEGAKEPVLPPWSLARTFHRAVRGRQRKDPQLPQDDMRIQKRVLLQPGELAWSARIITATLRISASAISGSRK